MNKGNYSSLMGKVSLDLGNIRLSWMLNNNYSQSRGYSHVYKYNPDGRSYSDANTSLMMVQLNHFLNEKMFYDIKYSITDNNYGSYVFEDYDSYEVIKEDGIYQGVYRFEGDTVYNLSLIHI